MQFIPLNMSLPFIMASSCLFVFAFMLGFVSNRYYVARSKRFLLESDKMQHSNQHYNNMLKHNSALSHRLHFAIKNLINSNYVINDRRSYKSLLQTPLRHNIQELRIIANSLKLDPSQVNVGKGKRKQREYEAPMLESWFDLQTMVKEVESAFISAFDHNEVKISFKTDIPLGFQVKSNWIQRALQELISNAIKSNKQTIQLSIFIGLEQQTLVMRVQDDGQGFRAEDTFSLQSSNTMSDLFSRRTSDAIRPLNLYSIKQYVCEQGGQFHIVSARHYSTTISVLLPLRSEQFTLLNGPVCEERRTYIAPQAPSIANGVLGSILLIEHNQGYASSILNELAKNYHVLHSTSITEGVQLLASHKIACILIDAESDYCNGISLKAFINGQTHTQDVSLILLGQNDPEIPQLTALRAGFSAVIEKPIIPSVLNLLIEHVLEEKSKVKQRVENELASYHANLGNLEDTGSNEKTEFEIKFNDVLSEHYAVESFTRTKAAKLLHMSDKTLSRRLAEFYGSGFSELMKRYRLVKAKDKIRQGERITQVAYDCGFSSPSYFTQCFRAEYGFAPSMLNKLSNCA